MKKTPIWGPTGAGPAVEGMDVPKWQPPKTCLAVWTLEAMMTSCNLVSICRSVHQCQMHYTRHVNARRPSPQGACCLSTSGSSAAYLIDCCFEVPKQPKQSHCLGPHEDVADQSSSPWQLRGNPERSSPACYWSRTTILSRRNHHPNLHACGQDTNPTQMLESNSQETRHTQQKDFFGSEWGL